VESVAILIGITIFIIVLLVLGGPELLRWQAGRNRDRYEILLPALNALAERLRSAAARMRHYRSLQAGVYQEAYQRTRAPMERAVAAFQEANQQRDLLRLPAVEAEGLAVRPFFQQPDLWVTIPRDALRLGRLQRAQTNARRALEEVSGGLKSLAHVPHALQERAAETAKQLEGLAATLAREKAAGVSGLGPWQERQEELAEEVQALAQLLRREPNQPLNQLDALAQALDQVEGSTAALDKEVTEMVSERQVLDEQLARARSTRERLAEGEVAAVKPLLGRSERMLAAAAEARQRATFEQARDLTGQARAVLGLANDLAELAGKVAALEAVADSSLEAAQIRDLVQAQNRAHQMVRDRLGAGEEAEGRHVALTAPAMRVVESLQAQARELDARAERLQALHAEQVQALEAEAAQEAELLERAWRELVGLLPPGPEEPIAERYQTLQEQGQMATGKPAQLRAYVGAARGLRTRVTDTAAYLKENLDWAKGLREEISRLLSTAEEEAGEWHSLQQQVTTIKESAAAIWQLDPASAETVEEALEALDEMQARQERALDAWEALQAGRQRVSAVEERIERVEASLVGIPMEVDEWERVEELAQGYVADAVRAETVEDAVVALQEVHRVLRDLATRAGNVQTRPGPEEPGDDPEF
jgi:hypothetical protein